VSQPGGDHCRQITRAAFVQKIRKGFPMKLHLPPAHARATCTLVSLLLLTLALCVASCKRSEVAGNANAGNGSSPTAANDATSTTPPFQTKEPERYQATMVITGSLGAQANVPGMSGLTTKEMLVARDKEKRRVDTELFPGMKVSYLQLASGSYMLVPAGKVYAELKPGGAGVEADQAKNSSPDFSPDKLLNQTSGGVRYEELGKEDVDGRASVKYRVTTINRTGESREVTTESLIWIDVALGMPIKSETTVTGGATSGAKYSTEMRDLKEDVDPSLFELPPDYRKVDYKDILRQAVPTVPSPTDKE
jgi:hypothetical protein